MHGKTDIIEFKYLYLTQPTVTPEDWLVHAMRVLTRTLKYVSPVISDSQIEYIAKLQELVS